MMLSSPSFELIPAIQPNGLIFSFAVIPKEHASHWSEELIEMLTIALMWLGMIYAYVKL